MLPQILWSYFHLRGGVYFPTSESRLAYDLLWARECGRSDKQFSKPKTQEVLQLSIFILLECYSKTAI